MVVTWEPMPGQSRLPARVVLSARTAAGVSLFEGSVEAVGTRAPAATICASALRSAQMVKP